MKKKILSLLLCLVLCLSFVPTAAFAAGYKAGDIAGTTGAGTENDPVVCDTFAELKAAMENTNIVFIKLGGANDMIPSSSGPSAAIRVSSRKVLTVTGNNVFTSPLNGNIDCLIDLTSNLEIKGTGILQYNHGNCGGCGAIVRVEATGNLTISERPALLGRANGNAFGRALYLYGGVTNISGGRFEGYSARPDSAGIEAVYICNDATLTVKDGTFSSSKHSSTPAGIEMSGLAVYGSPTVSLMGGTFYGVGSSVSLDSLLGTSYAYQNYANGPAVDMNGVYYTTDTLIVFADSTYNLTVENGTATIRATGTPATDVEAGTYIKIEANKISGKQFKNWEIVSGGPFTVEGLYTSWAFFNMPANDVTIRAVYEDSANSTYNLTVENGTATIFATGTPATDVEADTYIMIEANKISGKQFKNWEIVSGGPFTVEGLYTSWAFFNMPANDVTIRAVYEDSANSTYNLTVENGTATIFATGTPATDVEAGTYIMIEANEISGKQFKNWEIVSGGSFTVDRLYTSRAFFNMPANDVTIRAVYKEDEIIELIEVTVPGYRIGGNVADAVPTVDTKGITILSYCWICDLSYVTDGQFKEGREYTLSLNLVAEKGYKIKRYCDAVAWVSDAGFSGITLSGGTEGGVPYDAMTMFTLPKLVETIELIEVTVPGYRIGGNVADAVPTVNTKGITILSYCWMWGGSYVDGQFKEGREYSLSLNLVAEKGYKIKRYCKSFAWVSDAGFSGITLSGGTEGGVPYDAMTMFTLPKLIGPLAFTSQPASGTAKKSDGYGYSWALNDTPDYIWLQAFYGSYWTNLNNLAGQTSPQTITNTDYTWFRILAKKDAKEIVSGEFTVTWTDDTTPPELAFTSQPASGTAKKSDGYGYSWALNDTPDYIWLQAFNGLSWIKLKNLAGQTSPQTITITDYSTDFTRFRIFAQKDSKDIFSGEFTVTWTDDTTPSILWGDANGDGSVDSKDLSLLRKYMASYDYTTGISTVAVQPGADANGDGTIDSKDLSLLRKYMAAYDYTSGTSTVVLGPSK